MNKHYQSWEIERLHNYFLATMFIRKQEERTGQLPSLASCKRRSTTISNLFFTRIDIYQADAFLEELLNTLVPSKTTAAMQYKALKSYVEAYQY